MSFLSTYSGASINGYRSLGNQFGITQVLIPNDPGANKAFGIAVDINTDGSYIAINSDPYGGTANSTIPGACYIFTGTPGTYSQQQKISPSTGNAIGFGSSVSINDAGNTLAVGALTTVTTTSPTNGNVYIFTRATTSFSQQQVLINSDNQNNDYFGSQISLDGSGDYCLIGAPNWDGTNVDQGSAYIFYRSGGVWTQQQKLNPTLITGFPEFGSSVAISNDATYAVVGAPSDDTGGTNRGAVYVYTRSSTTWTLQQKINSTVASNNAQFGTFVSINDTNDKILIGCGFTPGTAVYFTRSGSTWSRQQTITITTGGGGVGSTNTPLDQSVISSSTIYNNLNIMSRAGSTWTIGQSIYNGSGSSALSYYGNIIIVGDPSYNSYEGIAYVITQ